MIQAKPNNNHSIDRYYFQLKPTILRSSLYLIKKIKIQVYKGINKLDFTKQIINIAGKSVILNDIGLNFYVPNYNSKSSLVFTIILIQFRRQQQELQIGRFQINANEYISALIINEGNFAFYQLTNQFNNDITLQYNLYVDRSKQSLINSINKLQTQKLLTSEKNIPKSSKQFTPYIESFEKSEQKLLTPKSRRQVTQKQPNKTSIMQINDNSRKDISQQLSQNSKKAFKRTGISTRELIKNHYDDKKKIKSVKNYQYDIFSNESYKIHPRDNNKQLEEHKLIETQLREKNMLSPRGIIKKTSSKTEKVQQKYNQQMFQKDQIKQQFADTKFNYQYEKKYSDQLPENSIIKKKIKKRQITPQGIFYFSFKIKMFMILFVLLILTWFIIKIKFTVGEVEIKIPKPKMNKKIKRKKKTKNQ